MAHYKTILTGGLILIALSSASVNANEFCSTPVNFETPEKVNRAADINLKPTHLVAPLNEGTPIFYNKSSQRDGYGYRVETKDYGPRPEPRHVFWSLNEAGNFFGPFDLKQDSYRSFERSGNRTPKVIYDPISKSNYFETGVNSEKLNTTGSGRSYTQLIEIPHNAAPKVWTSQDFNLEKPGISSLNWEEYFNSPVLRLGRDKMLFTNGTAKSIPMNKTRESNVFSETLAIKFDGKYYAMRSNRVNSVIPKKKDILPLVAKGTIVSTLRATADEGWYVGNVGRVYHDGFDGGYFTYTTTFRVEKTQAGIAMTEKKKFKPKTLFPFRSTGSCQVFSPILKQVIFCSRGKYLRNGRQVKMKGVKAPKDMKYIGDDSETRTALFQSSGQLFTFDGYYLKKMSTPKFRNVNGGVLSLLGRQFVFIDGKPFELSNGALNEISDLPKSTFGVPRELLSAGQNLLYVKPDGVFKILENSSATKIWEPPVGEYISHNRYKFHPTYVPFLDGLLFGTSTKRNDAKLSDSGEITDYYLLKKCEND